MGRYIIVGLGLSGTEAANFLTRAGKEVLLWDDMPAARAAAESKGFTCTPLKSEDLKAGDVLILSPGIPHYLPSPHPLAAAAKDLGIPILCDLDLLKMHAPQATFIGITGTNGKSTTTALTAHVLGGLEEGVRPAGNIGLPALSQPVAHTYVLEISSYQLERLRDLSFDIAACLNITPDHLDRHGGMDGYIQAKELIFKYTTGTAILNADDKYGSSMADRLPSSLKKIMISVEKKLEGGVYVEGDSIVDHVWGDQVHFRSITPLRGAHNDQNTLFSYVIARSQGVSPDLFLERLQTFENLPHRQTLVGEAQGVMFINDSKGTNLLSTLKALEAYDNIYWILGGVSKEPLDMGQLQPFLPKIRHAFLIGRDGPQFGKALEGHIPCTASGTLEKAVEEAFEAACKRGGTVLLSPASASFDQFKNFEERGALFEALAKRYVDFKG